MTLARYNRNYSRINWPRMMGKREGMSEEWDVKTRREMEEGMIEFTDNSVPHLYWKYRKTDPVLASMAIGGNEFSVRRHPLTKEWKIIKLIEEKEEPSIRKETPVSAPEEKEKKESVEEIPQTVTEFPEGSDYQEGIKYRGSEEVDEEEESTQIQT